MISSFAKLKKNQVKELLEKLSFFYDTNLQELEKFYFYKTNKGKVHISLHDVEKLNLPRTNSIGLCFGTYHDDERFRLSIEGTQLIKPKKNYVELKDLDSLKSYLAAENVFKSDLKYYNHENNCPFLIVKYKENNLGSVSPKGDVILNYVSKSRKLNYNKVF